MPKVPPRPQPNECPVCGGDLTTAGHQPGCDDDTGIVCMACCDTGYNSHGGDCYPCAVSGRLEEIKKRRLVGKLLA